jgi:hypothetical protein
MSALQDELFPPSFSASARNLQRQLETSPYSSLRGLTCVITKERIVLQGTVPCYYLKQVAQTLALRAIGAGRIQSDIEVESK